MILGYFSYYVNFRGVVIPKHQPKTRLGLQVVIRLLCCWVLLSLLIAGPVAWRLYRYNSVLGGTELSTLIALVKDQ